MLAQLIYISIYVKVRECILKNMSLAGLVPLALLLFLPVLTSMIISLMIFHHISVYALNHN